MSYERVLAARKKKTQLLAVGGFVGQAMDAVGGWQGVGNALGTGGGSLLGGGALGGLGNVVGGIGNHIQPPTMFNPNLFQTPNAAWQGSFAGGQPGGGPFIGAGNPAAMAQQGLGNFGQQVGGLAMNTQTNLGQNLAGAGQSAMGQQNLLGNTAMNQYQQSALGQQALIAQLQQQAAGGGPGALLAQQQYAQQTQANNAAGASMISSEKGLNPALQARMIAQNTAQNNQGASMGASQLGLQQQLAAQQQLGGVLQNSAALGAGTAGNAYGGNAGLGIGGANQALGNVGNTGLGTAANMYGNVGQQNIQSTLGQGQLQNAQNQTMVGAQQGTNALNQAAGAANLGVKQAVIGGAMNAAGGAASAAAMGASQGAVVPGQAQYAGDDERNDNVSAKLSAGEIVLPRSITEHPDAPWLAAKFVAQVLAGKGPKPSYEKAGGGEVGDGELAAGDVGMFGGAADPGGGGSIADWLLGGGGPGGNASAVGTAASAVPGLAQDLGQTMTQHNRDSMQTGDGNMGTMEGAAPLAPDQAPGVGAGGGTPTNLNTMGLPPPPAERGAQAGGYSPADTYNAAAQQKQDAFSSQEAAAKGIGAAQAAGGQQQAAAWDKVSAGMGKLQQDSDANYAAWKTDNDRLSANYASGKIDPQRLYKSMSTGNKISAAIGIILSGIGSGLTGQPNMAMGVINRAIEQDIDAQKADMQKNDNLLAANYRKYGTMQAAVAATHANLLGGAQAQAQAAMAKTAGAVGAGQMQLTISQIEQQKAELGMQVAQYQAFNQGGGGGDMGAKIRLGLQSGIIPQNMQATAMKEFGEYQELSNKLSTVQMAFKKVQDMQTVANRLGGGNPAEAYRQNNLIHSTIDMYSEQLAKDTAGRVTPISFDAIKQNFSTLTDDAKSNASKLQNIENTVKSKYSFPTLNSYLQLDQRDPLLRPEVGIPGARTIKGGK